MIQTFCGYTGLLNFLSCLGLALFLYFKNRSGKINKLFALWSTCVAFWSLGYFMWLFTEERTNALFWTRVLMAGAIVIPSAFLHFTLAYVNQEKSHLPLILFGYLFSLIYLGLDFTALFIQDVESRFWFRWWPVPGPLYHLYQAYFILMVIYTHVVLFRQAWAAPSEILRKHFKIVALGTLVAYLGGSTNFFLWYNIPIPPVFNFLVTGYVAFIAYAVLHYRLWDIEVIIRKTIVFAGLLTFIFGVFVVGLFVTQRILASYITIRPELVLVLSGFLIVLGYEPMRSFLIEATDRYLFQKKYDYQKFLKDASKGMSQIASLHHLMELVVHFITMKMRLRSAAILVRDLQTREFKLSHLRGYPPGFRMGGKSSDQSELIQYLTREKEAIEIDQIKEYIETGGKKSARDTNIFWFNYAQIKKEMEEMRAACCVPSYLGRELRNVLILGEKKSGDYYTPDDLNVLFTLAQESAIAIENARLYDEAVHRSKELEKMNKELQQTNEKLQVTQASLIVAEKNATMVGMAKAIGHEVNNPLSALTLQVGRIQRALLKMQEALNGRKGPIGENELETLKEEVKKNLTGIEASSQKVDNSAQRISAVVHTLTDILKGSTGEMGPLSLLVLCREAREATRFSTYEENLSGCKITEDVASDILVMGNLEQLLQVFVNLIKNAYEAMEGRKDRSVTISGDVDPMDPKMARIEIADNGPGIPPDILPKIWLQGFSTKIKKDDSIGAAGQGQGLFVSKHIIESIHKGSVSVESQAGKGTRFIVKLPLAEVGANV